MNAFLWGIGFAVGFWAMLFVVALFLALVMGLKARREENTEKETQEGTETVRGPIQTLDDEQLRKNVVKAAVDLDLLTRAALLRGMRVDAMLVNRTDQPQIYPNGRPSFSVRISDAEYEELERYPAGEEG